MKKRNEIKCHLFRNVEHDPRRERIHDGRAIQDMQTLLYTLNFRTIDKNAGLKIKLLSPLHLNQFDRPDIIELLIAVKAATLIFISGRGSAISSAKEGKSGWHCRIF